MVGFKFMKSEAVSLFFYGICMYLISLLINGHLHKKVRPLKTHWRQFVLNNFSSWYFMSWFSIGHKDAISDFKQNQTEEPD